MVGSSIDFTFWAIVQPGQTEARACRIREVLYRVERLQEVVENMKNLLKNYHYIRQLATYRKVTIDYIPTESMLADILTKPLTTITFKRCIQGLIATGHN
jgi:hypothetical protein